MDWGAWQATVHGVAESNMTEQLTHFSSKDQVSFNSKGAVTIHSAFGAQKDET